MKLTSAILSALLETTTPRLHIDIEVVHNPAGRYPSLRYADTLRTEEPGKTGVRAEIGVLTCGGPVGAAPISSSIVVGIGPGSSRSQRGDMSLAGEPSRPATGGTTGPAGSEGPDGADADDGSSMYSPAGHRVRQQVRSGQQARQQVRSAGQVSRPGQTTGHARQQARSGQVRQEASLSQWREPRYRVTMGHHRFNALDRPDTRPVKGTGVRSNKFKSPGSA